MDYLVVCWNVYDRFVAGIIFLRMKMMLFYTSLTILRINFCVYCMNLSLVYKIYCLVYYIFIYVIVS